MKITVLTVGKIKEKYLKDAIAELNKDTFIKEVLGVELCERYMEIKKEEWQQYTSQITPWEIDQYLDKY